MEPPTATRTLILVGCLLPWDSWGNPLNGWIRSGSTPARALDSLDGLIVLALGIFVVLLGASRLAGFDLPGYRVIMVSLGLLAVGAAVYERANLHVMCFSQYAVEPLYCWTKVGNGIYAIGAGGAIVAVASFSGRWGLALRVLVRAAQVAKPKRLSPSAAGLIRAAVVIAGGLIVSMGCFLPWVATVYKASYEPGSLLASISGVDGRDGQVVLALGALLVLLGASRFAGFGLFGYRPIVVTLGLLAVGAAVYEAVNVHTGSTTGFTPQVLVTTNIGNGIYAIGAGGAIVAVASLLGASGDRLLRPLRRDTT